jgi:SpoU rRNA Methylase family
MLDREWWQTRPWRRDREWWLWLPESQYSLNTLLLQRVAHALGAQGVISAEPPHTTEGWLGMTTTETVAFAAERELPLVALEQGGTPVSSFGRLDRGLLVLGHEQRGLDPAIVARCLTQLSLPQWGSVRSYNVAMAASIALDALLA